MDTVHITQSFVGICHMQVCATADATDKEILAVCNDENPAGTTGGWQTVHRGAAGPKAPVACAQDARRVHLLVSC